MAMQKYRVHQVAKDFNLTSKSIADILHQFDIPVKNHMQVLAQSELDIIFEFLTQHSTKYAPLQDAHSIIFSSLSTPTSQSNLQFVIIEWDDNGYYVAKIDPSTISREFLVDTCANHAAYYDNYQEAVDTVKSFTNSFQEIKLSDYPVPDLGAL